MERRLPFLILTALVALAPGVPGAPARGRAMAAPAPAPAAAGAAPAAVIGTWSTNPSMPTPRYGPAAAAANGKVYAFGGVFRINSTSIDSTAVAEEFDPATNAWATKAPMPTARSFLAAATFNGKI